MKGDRTVKDPVYRRQREKTRPDRGFCIVAGKRVYFGPYDSPESRQWYHQFVSELIENGGHLPVEAKEITIIEIVDRFWSYAKETYKKSPESTLTRFKPTLKKLKKLYGELPASQFGPKKLKILRAAMVEKEGARKTINDNIRRIKQVFKWACSEELIPASIYEALKTVEGLKRGRSKAKEPKPVKPVSKACIEAVRPLVSRQVWGLIQLQLYTGSRSGEIVIIRPCDIDKTAKIWVYRPQYHKTEHHGHERTIFIGPKGQEVLTPFLNRPPWDYCFSPAEAEAERLKKLHAERKTPLCCGNRPGTNRRKKPQKKPGNHYTVNSYRRAIQEACKKAEINSWHPHQLRHNAATNLRKEFGIEVTRIILGHKSLDVTEIYAEADTKKAVDVMKKYG